ncbi:hypothetical protein OOK13_13820 [Streptomyces sp. NBC_00378]|uniref:hypothetical protein n=1 Tax=unclassified Streptomyces TaxID=2593676 RepID=UPI002257BBFA|nr:MULTISPECIES: hypothetical protein [unclassified Streptomyces]MCX5109596.1 hypothetical protein [Streptomyces sp. NBC_00378]
MLALIVAGWVVRDVRAADGIERLWHYWAGYRDAQITLNPATSPYDVVLFAVYVAAAVASLRSSVAAATLVATGVLTIVVRLPGLWNIGEPRMDGRFVDDLRTRALLCAFASLAAGIALIITAAAGRRCPAAGRRAPHDFSEDAPARPGQGAGVIAFLCLGAAGAVTIAWEIRQAVRIPYIYPDWFLGGDKIFQGLTDPPPGWFTAVLALLCLFAGVSGLPRAVHARPFGLIAAALLLGGGGVGVARSVHEELLEHFADLPVEAQLTVATGFFEVFVGVVVLLALARPGPAAPPPLPDQGYGQGYGYPRPGVFGPPPPSQPPPGW